MALYRLTEGVSYLTKVKGLVERDSKNNEIVIHQFIRILPGSIVDVQEDTYPHPTRQDSKRQAVRMPYFDAEIPGTWEKLEGKAAKIETPADQNVFELHEAEGSAAQVGKLARGMHDIGLRMNIKPETRALYARQPGLPKLRAGFYSHVPVQPGSRVIVSDGETMSGTAGNWERIASSPSNKPIEAAQEDEMVAVAADAPGVVLPKALGGRG